MTTSSISINSGSHVRVPPVSPGTFRIAAAVEILGILLLTTTFYQVKPEEVGVVLRFGRYVRTTEPGLHVKLPFVEARHAGSGPAPAEGGVRIPHGRGGDPVPVLGGVVRGRVE